MRLSILLFVSLAAVSPLLYLKTAEAQISDSEKQAARQLFTDGVELQKGGKYEEALDKLERAQKVIQAPTHLVHIAECQTALGKLVEAAESYRAAIRMPASGNATFTQAQEQAQAELRPLEPRIPKVKLDVTPKDVANVSVAIDGSPISAALLDVAVPLNPGTHRIAVFAPGYANDEKSITLSERDNKQLSFSLTATGAVFPPDPINPNPNPVPTYPPYRPQPRPYRPQPQQPPPDTWHPVEHPVERSFLIGARGGVVVPGGNFMSRSGLTGGDVAVSNIATTGGSIGVDAGFRFYRLYVGLTYEFASFGKGDGGNQSITTGEPFGSRANALQNVTVTTSSHYIGLDLGYISNPTGLGLYADIGLGYRVVPHSLRVEDTGDPSRSWQLDETFSGAEFKLGAGIYIAAGSWLRLVPKVTVGLGSFTNLSTTCTDSGLGPNFTCASFTSGPSQQTISQNSAHSFVFLGMGGYFDKEIR